MAREATQAPGLRLPSLPLDDAWRAAASDALVALVASRLLVLLGGIGAVLLFGESPRAADFDPAGLAGSGDVLAAPFARWDSVWFLSIAHGGYDDPAQAAFFPLYPLLLAATGGTIAGGALLSTLLFGVALTVLHRLVAVEVDPRLARGAVLAMAFCPMSFFASAVYSESLFLALSVGSLYAARRDRWALAGVLGALAATTRSAGVVLVLPLAITAWRRRPVPLARAAWIGLVPLGLVAFVAFLWLDGEDPWGPFSAQDVWFRSFAGPFAGIWDGAVAAFQGARQLLSGSRSPVYFTEAGGDPFYVAAHNVELFAWLLLAVPAVVGTVRRLPLAWSAYVVAALALPLSYPVGPQPLMSLPRFLFVLFPLFVWVALWCDGRLWRGRVLLALGAIGLTVYSGIFATWHFVA